jgi:anti-sigma regulatory factor (Ser/Thr protein kinase)
MKMAKNKYSFQLKNDLSELRTLYWHLNHFGQIYGLTEALISEINICLDELFTNTVLYGFKDDLEHIFRFTINLNDQTLILKIEDNGMPFNPLKKKNSELPADIDKARIGGLGIHIVKKLIDDIRYERKQGKNRLTLKRFVHTTSHIYQTDNSRNIPSNYFA